MQKAPGHYTPFFLSVTYTVYLYSNPPIQRHPTTRLAGLAARGLMPSELNHPSMASMSSVSSSVSLPHPGVWRASQVSSGQGRVIDTGFAGLSAELPGGGWPCGELVELMPACSGMGEIRLLQPALAALPRPGWVALVRPPHIPHVSGWASWYLNPGRLLWVRPQTLADALWATDQLLKSDGCAAVLSWLPRARSQALRRLHLAAQGHDVLFVVLREPDAAQSPSPAPLRLGLQPVAEGVHVYFIKRRGPARDEPLHVPIHRMAPRRVAPPETLPQQPALFTVPGSDALDRRSSVSP